MSSLTPFAREKLARLEAQQLRRTLAETRRQDGIWVMHGGRRLLSFSCNDYLNLTHDPRVKAAAIAAIDTHGTGAGASRLVTGNCPLFGELETRLAAFKAEAACLFGWVISPMPESFRFRRRRRSTRRRRTRPFLPVGRRKAFAGRNPNLPAQRCSPCCRDSLRGTHALPPCARRHRDGVLDGWRSRAARGPPAHRAQP